MQPYTIITIRMPIRPNAGVRALTVWYRVVAFTNVGPDSRCVLCCGWGHIENKRGNMPNSGYCSGNHRTSDHKCAIVGCTAKQGSLSGHTLEKCPNCKGNHIGFSSRCEKKSEATEAARRSRKTGTSGLASMSDAAHMATGTNRVVLGHRPRGGRAADGGRKEMADAKELEATGEARDVIMTDAEIPSTTATETEAGALATSNYSDPAQLPKVIRVDRWLAGDGTRTQGGCSVLARATRTRTRY